jgi:hypothetical protein
MEHSIPSASSIDDCILKQWYISKGREPDTEIPVAWKKAQLSGILSELAWIADLRQAGLDIELPKSLSFKDGLMYGRPDAIASYRGSEKFAIEIKERTGYVYKKYVSKYGSVAMTESNVYSQIQTYIEAAKVDWALLLVSPKDHSMIQSTMRANKQWGAGYDLPPFHLEWVERNDNHIEYLFNRATKIKDTISNIYPPDREFSGIPIGADGKKTWPCGYCIYNKSCVSEFGYGNR